jgi:hypothetical protein
MELGLLLLLALLVAWVFSRAYDDHRRRSKPSTPAPDVADAAQQLGFVSRVTFERQPLLNKSEFQVLLLLEGVVRELRAGHRVMAQTSLGEILRPKRDVVGLADADLAYRSINSKRADFVVVDQSGLAVLVVEYQGHGHYQGNAKLRDAVKREAFRSAGVALIEVPARFEKEAIAREARGILLHRTATPSKSAPRLQRSIHE